MFVKRLIDQLGLDLDVWGLQMDPETEVIYFGSEVPEEKVRELVRMVANRLKQVMISFELASVVNDDGSGHIEFQLQIDQLQ